MLAEDGVACQAFPTGRPFRDKLWLFEAMAPESAPGPGERGEDTSQQQCDDAQQPVVPERTGQTSHSAPQDNIEVWKLAVSRMAQIKVKALDARLMCDGA